MDGRSPTHNRNTAGSKNGTSKSNTSERTNIDENVDPIGYQAIVLDPNPKAVCQLLGKFKIIQFGSNFSKHISSFIVSKKVNILIHG